jgi:hypothetical protein
MMNVSRVDDNRVKELTLVVGRAVTRKPELVRDSKGWFRTRVITASEVALAERVHPRTVRRWCANGALEAHRNPKHGWRIALIHFDAFHNRRSAARARAV